VFFEYEKLISHCGISANLKGDTTMKIQTKKELYTSAAIKTLALIVGISFLSGCEPTSNTDNVAATTEAAGTTKVTAGAAMVLPATTSSDSALKLYMAGWADFENSRNLTANKKFQAAAADDPSFTMAHVMSAWTANSTEGFVTSVGKAAESKDGASKGEKLLVNMLERFLANDAAGATASARELTELHPNAPRAWSFLGNAYANTNDTDSARKAYKMVTMLDPSYVPGFIDIGNNYLSQEPKNFSKAEAYFQKAVALTPSEPNPHDLLGDVHRAQGNLEAAYRDYTTAAELAPTLGAGLQQRGHVNSFLGNFDEARDDYNRAAELEDARGSTAGPGFRVFGAYVNLHEGNPDAAIAELQDIAEEMVRSSMDGASDIRINVLYNIAGIAMESGKYDVAEKAISDAGIAEMQQADKLDSDDIRDGAKASQYYFSGLLAAKRGGSAEAIASATSFKEQVSKSSNPLKLERMHEILGMNAYHQGDFAAAANHLTKGNHVNNMNIKYYLARANEQAGNASEAARLYDEMAVYNFNGPGYAMFRKDILARAAAN